MKIFCLMIILLAATAGQSQTQFRLNGASKNFDVVIDVGVCGTDINFGECGPVRVDLYRKGAKRAFQSIRLPQTEMWDTEPKANITRRYDEQSVINFRDFDFDGREDIAICDGNNGGYHMPSYRVYIYSKKTNRFVYSRPFTRMNYGGLGMFETDQKKKMHYVFSKSGCCWHRTEGFDVFNGKPRKVYELTEDGSSVYLVNHGLYKITTRKFIHGKWRTWVKRFKK